MVDLSNENIIHIKKNGIEYIQFKKLLEYDNIINGFTLKPLDFGDNNNYLVKQQEIANNYRLICNELKVSENDIVRPFQTHTSNVKIVENESGVFPENLKEIDGLITNQSNKILSLTFADCTPIYLWDPVKKVIGNIHSGWKGTVQKIGRIAVEKMIEEYKCNPKDIICCIGPTIRKCHFEVQDDVKEIFEDTFNYQKDFCTILQKGKIIDGVQKYFIDTVKINKNLMEEAGLKRENIIDSGLCTVCHSTSFHSYRAEGNKSRKKHCIIWNKIKGGKMIPKKLEKGDIIAVIAPSSPITANDTDEINEAILLMEKEGFKITFSRYALSNTLGYGATAKQKAEDINQVFANPEIKAIFCARGGANSNSVFEYLDYEIINKNPKIICGFSDSTSLLNIIHEKANLVTFHGSTFKSLIGWGSDYSYKEVIKRFKYASMELGNKEDTYQTIKQGQAQGILIGGNLSLISDMVAGKYAINFENKILFLEELFEESSPEMVSHCLYHMKQNEVFKKINGIWIGNYQSPISLEQIILDVIGDEYAFPIIKSDNFGHIDKKTVIPIGTMAKIDTNNEIKITLLEPCVE